MDLEVQPLTPDTWDDFETVMGPKGGDAGCWCMYNRQTSREFAAAKGEPSRSAIRDLVDSGEVPRLIGYRAGNPIGWVAIQ